MQTQKILYRGMDRDELDRQYDARATVDDIQPYLDSYTSLSAKARQELDAVLDIPYGPHAAETLDFFPAGSNAPLFIFIHGGYWRLLSKNESSFCAHAFVQAGIAFAAVNYSLAPAANLDTIVHQVRQCVAFLWQSAGEYAIDRDRIHVGGSSAGGHLVGMLLNEHWQDELGLPRDVIAGAVSASGLFDLEPIRLCHPNEWLQLDEASAQRNSPILHIPTHGPPLIATWGGTETNEFKRQSKDFACSWRDAGFPVDAFEISDRNHFDIILDLTDPTREFSKRVIAMVNCQQSKP